MDDQNITDNVSKSLPQKLLTRRNIFIVLGLIIAAELLWAGWTLYQTNRQIGTTAPVTFQPQPSKIELQSNKTTVKVADQVTVSINVVSEKATDGIDLVINYDPKLLSVVKTKEGTPVILGSLYSDYPQNAVDETKGEITISGISTGKEGVRPNGLFGSIVFNAKAPGQTTVSLEFSPGSTVDTNITEKGTGEDVLESVGNVNITINP